MSRRFQLNLTDAQYQRLTAESRRSSVSVAELIRRAIDEHTPAGAEGRVRNRELSVRFARWPAAGRRSGVRL
jgi:hypothetical protein